MTLLFLFSLLVSMLFLILVDTNYDGYGWHGLDYVSSSNIISITQSSPTSRSHPEPLHSFWSSKRGTNVTGRQTRYILMRLITTIPSSTHPPIHHISKNLNTQKSSNIHTNNAIYRYICYLNYLYPILSFDSIACLPACLPSSSLHFKWVP